MRESVRLLFRDLNVAVHSLTVAGMSTLITIELLVFYEGRFIRQNPASLGSLKGYLLAEDYDSFDLHIKQRGYNEFETNWFTGFIWLTGVLGISLRAGVGHNDHRRSIVPGGSEQQCGDGVAKYRTGG